ncbi:GGDEF domain-containing protein [Luteibacter aegosomaticola]|uniref:GGDEF domain-containing protein n=1 Tax=Luteibacter aegosomaticola TaxID=2911538 RepID=UPI001FF76205|nr:GGDEF domain-containing protein [Luteibacter aegosomaticola]UPG88294.1 GGDEF domain-containing protein [Luteibacter aegosomaticola]
MEPEVRNALLTEVQHSTARAKLTVQAISIVAVLIPIFLDDRIWVACGALAPLVVCAMAGLMALSQSRSMVMSRLAAPAFVLLETGFFCLEARALGPEGIVWCVPIVTTIALAAALFFSRFPDYLVAALGSWVVLFGVTGGSLLTVFVWYLLLTFAVVVSAIGMVMQRAFSGLVGRLMMARVQFEILANTDDLTALSNRRRFLEELHRALQEDGRVLVMVDIDHFKQINDRYGHPTGDIVIRAVAEHMMTLEGCIACGRLGGEEFAAVLTVPINLAAAACEPMRTALRAATLPVTISVGIVSATAGESVRQILGRADIQLYKAKAHGRDCIAVEGVIAPQPVTVPF